MIEKRDRLLQRNEKIFRNTRKLLSKKFPRFSKRFSNLLGTKKEKETEKENNLFDPNEARLFGKPIFHHSDPNITVYEQRQSVSKGQPYYVHIQSCLTDWNIESLRKKVKTKFPNLVSGGKLYKKAKKAKKAKKDKKDKKEKKGQKGQKSQEIQKIN